MLQRSHNRLKIVSSDLNRGCQILNIGPDELILALAPLKRIYRSTAHMYVAGDDNRVAENTNHDVFSLACTYESLPLSCCDDAMLYDTYTE